MLKSTVTMTRALTARCLFALAVVAVLSLANYLLLRAEIRANETGVELLTISGRQRTLLQSTSLLAQALVNSDSKPEREQLREELLAAIEPLEAAHFQLVEFDLLKTGEPLPEVQEIYENTPHLLDTEVRNYLTHLRELARSKDGELTLVNSHFRYIRDVGLSRLVMDGLNAVVEAYQQESQNRAGELRRMARWSLNSTWIVLGLTGAFVFRPMVVSVKTNVAQLQQLNETLEQRVQERTAIAEQRAQKLADSEALYHSLVENLPLAVVRKDLQGRLTYVNKLYGQLTGQLDRDLLGASDQDLFPPEQAACWRSDDAQVVKSGEVFQRVQQHATSDGQTVHFELLKAPIRDAADNVIGTQTVFWDVTQRKAAEDRMLRAERLAAVGEMVAAVAHESRNALQQIGVCAKMLQWQLEDQSEAMDLIADVQKAHDRLHRLFENLRGYVSPLKLERRRSSLASIFREAWETTASLRASRQVELIHRGRVDDVPCMVDPFQMEQVFRNVLENSLAACADPAQIVVHWQSTSLRGNPGVRITLSDNGPGIPSGIADRVFEPFFTTKTQGTGLGMVIVQRIVEAHGGTIRVLPPKVTAGQDDRGGAQLEINLPQGNV